MSWRRAVGPPAGGWPVLAGAEDVSLPGAPEEHTAVLVLHGFTGSPSSVLPVAHALADAGFAVRVPLLPGHGTHWRDLARSGWDEWATAATTELRALRATAERVVVVGHSNGGALALHLAEREPAAVAGLVLINPAVSLADRRLVALPLLRRVRSSVPGVAGDIEREGVSVVGYDRTPLAALASMLRGWRGVRAELPAVRCPVLLLRSRIDHVVDAAGARTVLSRISSTEQEAVVLERGYHEAPVDHDGAEVASRAVAFVTRFGTRTGASVPDSAG